VRLSLSRWQDYGIDASLYSRKLLRNVADAALLEEEALAGDASSEAVPPAPRELLAAAQAVTREPGAATAVLLALDGAARTAHAVNLGDSGYRHFRNAALIASSTPQQHGFDCPYQLGYSKFIADNDTAAMGDVTALSVQEGDLLLLASDGLFDNMDESEMVGIMRDALAAAPLGGDGASGAHAAAAGVAAALASVAAAHARDASYDSPYARESVRNYEAQKAEAAAAAAAAGPFGMFAAALSGGKKGAAGGGLDKPTSGGKLDDVTVVAALVVAADAPGAAAELAASDAAAAAARAAVPSAVGDAAQEGGRPVLIGTTEAEEAAAVKAVAGAAKAARAAEGLPAFDAAAVAAMDATQLRKALTAAGLPSSGKLEVLRARLTELKA
jgi:protein phosphatase PTC7